MMSSHLTFFSDWSGQSFLSYILALIFVISISLLVEWLSNARLVSSSTTNNVTAGFLQAFMYGVRIALAYLLMFAVMSFDIGVLLAAVAGYSLGFLIFASQAFRKTDVQSYHNLPDLPPLNC